MDYFCIDLSCLSLPIEAPLLDMVIISCSGEPDNPRRSTGEVDGRGVLFSFHSARGTAVSVITPVHAVPSAIAIVSQ